MKKTDQKLVVESVWESKIRMEEVWGGKLSVEEQWQLEVFLGKIFGREFKDG